MKGKKLKKKQQIEVGNKRVKKEIPVKHINDKKIFHTKHYN